MQSTRWEILVDTHIYATDSESAGTCNKGLMDLYMVCSWEQSKALHHK